MNLYEDLKTKVNASGFTMKAVCERAGVSTGTPTHWAAGRTSANQGTYNKMVAALHELVEERQEQMMAAGLVG